MPVESIVVLSLIVAVFGAFIGILFCLSWGSGGALTLDDAEPAPKREDVRNDPDDRKVAAD